VSVRNTQKDFFVYYRVNEVRVKICMSVGVMKDRRESKSPPERIEKSTGIRGGGGGKSS
jgi:hypothetical protein